MQSLWIAGDSSYLGYVEIAYTLDFRALDLILLPLPNAAGVADKESDDEQRYYQPTESRTSPRTGMHPRRAFRFLLAVNGTGLDQRATSLLDCRVLARRLEATYIPSPAHDARLMTITYGRRGGGHYHVPPFAFLLFLRFQSATCSARTYNPHNWRRLESRTRRRDPPFIAKETHSLYPRVACSVLRIVPFSGFVLQLGTSESPRSARFLRSPRDCEVQFTTVSFLIKEWNRTYTGI